MDKRKHKRQADRERKKERAAWNLTKKKRFL